MSIHRSVTGGIMDTAEPSPTGRGNQLRQISLSLDVAPAVNYAFQQNAVAIVHGITVINDSQKAVGDLIITLNSEPAFAETMRVRVAELGQGETRVLTAIDLKLAHSYLSSLSEAVRGTLTAVACHQDAEIGRCSSPIEVLAYDQWAGTRALPELLASFSQPNNPAVAEILRAASQRLLDTGGHSLCGYQAKDRQDVMRQVGAIYAAIAGQGIHYANPPANFTVSGQKVRTPDRVLREHLGTCLDLTMLLCSCLEQAGLNPVVLLKKGHSWVACWLVDTSLQSPTLDDGQALRKRVEAGEMIAIETTLMAQHANGPVSAAVKRGGELLGEEHQADFDLAIDVKRARGHRILPLPSRDVGGNATTAPDAPAVPRALDDEVALPPLDPTVVVPTSQDPVNPTGRARIEHWKAKLLDLTLRNKLLNFKPTKQTIPIYYPEPGRLEDLLAEGKAFKFNSLPALLGPADPRSADLMFQRTQTVTKEEIARTAFERSELLANIEHDDLDGRLTEIFRSARTSVEEGGANTLFLTIGMLKWIESKDSEQPLLAPIIMFPVSIERTGIANYRLKRHDDDTVVNPTLLQKLEHDFGIRIPHVTGCLDLPTDDSGINVDAILALFRQATIDLKGFEIRTDVHLGLFSFTKFLMWRDLANRTEHLLANRLVRHLVDRESESYRDLGEMSDERSLDSLRKPADLYVPVDADSSQLAAVHAAVEGRDFVLEGPPGTGKSQTITNIISDMLARGKTVLFVSEKMAALQVVHERLKTLGLGPFLLELHSSKASKAEVLQQFAQALGAGVQRTVSEWEVEAGRLARLREQLNGYVNELHQQHANGLSVFEATAMVVSKPHWQSVGYAWTAPDAHTREQLDDLRSIARQIQSVFGLLGSLRDSGLRQIRRASWAPLWQEQLLAAAAAADQCLASQRAASEGVESVIGLKGMTHSPAEFAALDRLAEMLLQVPGLPPTLLTDGNVAKSCELLSRLSVHGRKRSKHWAALGGRYRADAAKLNGSELDLQWRAAQSTWWPKKFFASLALRNRLKPVTLDGTRPLAAEVADVIAAIVGLNEEDRALTGSEVAAATLLGNLWRGIETQWSEVDRAQRWLTSFAQIPDEVSGTDVENALSLRTKLQGLMLNNPSVFRREGTLGSKLLAYRDAQQACLKTLDAVVTLAGTTPSEFIGDARTPDLAGRLRPVLRSWMANPRGIRDWCNWLAIKTRADTVGLAPFIDAIEEQGIQQPDIEAFFEFSFREWWLKRTVDRSPLLCQFSALQHEQAIRDFRACDARFAELTKQYVHAKLAGKIPSAAAVVPQSSPLGTLRHEIRKQRRHMPVRKLMGTISPLLPSITPCMLMSPLSVAQYLDTADVKFDVVIFDEASQIPTWDAIGAIARGKQVIVVGDPKQLPPTNFFTRNVEDKAAESEVEDLESILDECMGAGLANHSLKWHYRSQSESLIAFSNLRYYKSQLITFPNPITEDRGVTYHHVPGVYQRSGARTNRQEAEVVVDHIKRHFADPGLRNTSIGVVTFSEAQQSLVEDLLDAARRADTTLDRHITAQKRDQLFVKNLENVQGDERDIILFSICYGPDANGEVKLNFGPLNRTGGSRRLNVAVTRARQHVHVYATLRPEQIDAARTQAGGVIDLKLYLEMAIKGPKALLAHSSPTGRGSDSVFEEQVLARLTDDGWVVHPQVGCSGYRIDLAVVDPRGPGRYLMAVECDGASYHSAATARDRDHLRQKILERLGWKVHRIWSTEWWTNPEREVQRMIRALERAMAAETDVTAPPVAKPDVEASDIFAPEAPYASAFSGGSQSSGASLVVPPAPTATPMVLFDSELAYAPVSFPLRDKDAFYAPGESAALASMVSKVIEFEGPVSEELIASRVMAAYGINRMGNRVLERIQSFCLPYTKTVDDGRVFRWPGGMSPDTWRGYRSVGDRSFDDVPLEELANLTAAALKGIGGADATSLARVVLQRLSIQRMTQRIEARMRTASEKLVLTGRATRSGNGYVSL